MKKISGLFLIAFLSLFSLVASAEDTTVKAVGVQFEAAFIFIEAGDKVSWENMNSHNVESIDELVPEGTEKIMTTVGDDVTLTFDKPGIYVYKCTPHWGARMGGVIMVGQQDNAMETVNAYLETVGAQKGNLLPAKGLLKKFIKELESRS